MAGRKDMQAGRQQAVNCKHKHVVHNARTRGRRSGRPGGRACGWPGAVPRQAGQPPAPEAPPPCALQYGAGQGSPACTARMSNTAQHDRAQLRRRQHASAPPTKWLFSPVINSTTSSGTARGHRECPTLPTCGVGKHGALLPAHVLLHVAAHTVKLQGRYGDRQGAKRQKIRLETQA